MLNRSLSQSNNLAFETVNKLSSGIKINSASDNAADLELSTKLSAKTSGLSVANNNIQTGLTKLQTFASYLGGITDALQKVRSLALQSSNGTYSDKERSLTDNTAQEYIREAKSAANQANTELGVGPNDETTKEVLSLSEIEIAAAGYDENHIIRSATEFQTKIGADMSGDFILANNLDFSELGIVNDSVITGNFSGNFDGNGYVMSGVSMNITTDDSGLFAELTGSIKNAALEGVYIETNIDCFVVGGLVGLNNGGSIDNSYATGTINRLGNESEYVGLIAGRNRAGASITNSYAQGDVNGYRATGGIVGANDAGCTISNISFTGTVVSHEEVAGVTGDNYGLIENAYVKADLTSWDNAGGIAARNYGGGTITKCYTTSLNDDIESQTDVGGVVGYNAGTVAESGTSAKVYGQTVFPGRFFAGGFAGSNFGGTISNCYATGDVTGYEQVGGFVGEMDGGSITNSFSTGSVTCITHTDEGGFAGRVSSGSIDASNFWDSQKSGFATTAGSAVGLTTEEISSGATPIDSWSETTWDLSGNIPALRALKEIKGTEFSLQIGSESGDSSIYEIDQIGISIGIGVNLGSAVSARSAINNLDNAIEYLTTKNAQVNSEITRLDTVLNSNKNRDYGLTASNSSIKDTDIALESAKLAKNQITQQSSISIMQQANNINRDLILSLF